MKAPINRIIPFSNVDGPGNRCSIFFQGCPFSCLYCHNPETIHPCINCGKCVNTCPVSALSIEDGIVKYDRCKCIDCDTCIKVCENLASPKIEWLSVADLVSRVKKIKPFIRGITVSGGECMVHAEFLFELFKEVKKLGLTCFIDSNGAFDFELYQPLLDLCDGVMLDVKATNNDFHYDICAYDNAVVLKNLQYLLDMNKLEEVRTVILPSNESENYATVDYVSKLIGNKCRYKLLKYRYFGVREAGLDRFGKYIVNEDILLKYQNLCIENGCFQSVII